MNAIQLLREKDARQAYLRLLMGLQAQQISTQEFIDAFLKRESDFDKFKAELQDERVQELCLLCLLHIRRYELSQDLQVTLTSMAQREAQEDIFAVLLQNKVDARNIKALSMLLVKKNFDAGILLFCSAVDPENQNLQALAQHFLASPQPKSTLADHLISVAVSLQTPIYEQALRVVQKHIAGSVSFSLEELYTLSQITPSGAQEVMRQLLQKSDYAGIGDLLLVNPSYMQQVELFYETKRRFDALETASGPVILQAKQQRFDFNTIFAACPEAYFASFCSENRQLQAALPAFPQVVELTPAARRNFTLLEDALRGFKLHRNILLNPRVLLGLLPLCCTQASTHQALDGLVRLVEENCQAVQETLGSDVKPDVVLLCLGLLSEETRTYALDKLRLHEFFTGYMALYSDFQGVPGLEDLTFQGFDIPVHVGSSRQETEEFSAASLVKFNSDAEFYGSREFGLLDQFIREFSTPEGRGKFTTEQTSQVREELLDLMARKVGEFQLTFFDVACQAVQATVLTLLLRTAGPENAIRASFLVRFTTEPALIQALFTDRQHLRKLILLNLLAEIELIAGIKRPHYALLGEMPLRFAQTALQAQAQNSSKVQFDFYRAPENPEEISKVLPLLSATDPRSCLDCFFDGDGGQDGNKAFLENAFTRWLCGASPTTEDEIMSAERARIAFCAALERVVEQKLELKQGLADGLTRYLEYLQVTYKAPERLTLQMLKDMRLFGLLLQVCSACPVAARTGVLSLLPVVSSESLPLAQLQRCSRQYSQILARFLELQNSSIPVGVSQLVGAYCQRILGVPDTTPRVLRELLEKSLRHGYPSGLDPIALCQLCQKHAQTMPTEDAAFVLRLFAAFLATPTATAEQVSQIANLVAASQIIHSAPVAAAQFITALRPRAAASIAGVGVVRRGFLLAAKLALQELFFVLQKSGAKAEPAAAYQTAYLAVLEAEPSFIAENRMIKDRSSARGVYFTAVFASALAESYSEANVARFVKDSRCGAAFLDEFFSDEAISFVIEVPLSETHIQSLHLLYIYWLQERDDGLLGKRLLERLLQVECDSEPYLDLLQRICTLHSPRDSYTFWSVSGMFSAQKRIAERYQQYNARQQTLALLFLSASLQKYSLEFLTEFAITLANQLDFQGSALEKITLAFLCHVRNLSSDQRKRSEILPRELFKHVRTLKQHTE